jgi:hypothetical protein
MASNPDRLSSTASTPSRGARRPVVGALSASSRARTSSRVAVPAGAMHSSQPSADNADFDEHVDEDAKALDTHDSHPSGVRLHAPVRTTSTATPQRSTGAGLVESAPIALTASAQRDARDRKIELANLTALMDESMALPDPDALLTPAADNAWADQGDEANEARFMYKVSAKDSVGSVGRSRCCLFTRSVCYAFFL